MLSATEEGRSFTYRRNNISPRVNPWTSPLGSLRAYRGLDEMINFVEKKDMKNSWKIYTENHTLNCFNAEHEKKWQAPWYFVLGADPQYGYIDDLNSTPDLSREIELTEKVVEKVNKMNPKPRFFVVCGDLCNTVPSANSVNFKIQEKTFKKIFGKIDPSIPVLVLCGNHDIGDKPTCEDFKLYKSSWGDDYYSFWCGGVLFLVLNSQFYKGCEEAELAEKHEKWLEDQLQKSGCESGSRVILFQHIPWFINSADEENDYFAIDKDIRDTMLNKLVCAGVQKVFCGHCHRNAGGTYKNMEVIVTTSMCGQLGSDESGVRVVKVYSNKIDHTFYKIDEIPATVTFD